MGVEGASSRCSVAFALSHNLGDDVQSLALSGLVRGGIRVYLRDFLSGLPQDIESGVLSGWLSRNRQPFDGHWLAGKMLPLSFYLRTADHVRGHWLDYFRAARLVATRDVATRDRLRELGVEADFGGSFSLFSARALPFREGGDVPYVVSTDVYSFEALCSARDEHVILLDPNTIPGGSCLDIRARISACLFWLWLIRGARALYTDRLHAALPAVGYGTGVFVSPTNRPGPERFSGYEEMLGSRDAEKGLVGAAQIDELTDVLQRCGGHVPLLEFGFRHEMGIREMYMDLIERVQFAATEEEADAGFKRGALLFLGMLKLKRGKGSGARDDLPEVLSYARELARELAEHYVSGWLPGELVQEFRGYAAGVMPEIYEWTPSGVLRDKIKGMLSRLGLI